jgi:hybrid cluster-associated redox disulfide protein
MNQKKITKDMTFGEILKDYPRAVPIFLKFGMHCIGCHIAVSETLEQGALAHGVDADELVEDLNKHLVESSAEKEDKKSRDS